MTERELFSEWARTYNELQVKATHVVNDLNDADPDRLRAALGSVAYRHVEEAIGIMTKSDALLEECMFLIKSKEAV